MTAPSPETLERLKDTLYVSDAEIVRRMGVPEREFRKLLPALESKYGFPQKSPFFPTKRYWPAVRAWLDRHDGINMVDPQGRARS